LVNHPLQLELTTLQNNVARLRILENHPKRYQGPAQDVITNIKETPFTTQESTENSYTLSFGNNKAKLQFNPFRLEFYNGEQLILSTNSRDLFNFEPTRDSQSDDHIPKEIINSSASKPENWDDEMDGVWEPPKMANPATEGRWEEHFGTHRDSKPKGPTSVGLDFTFEGVSHVYGIPEHAEHLKLGVTRTSTGEVKSDPYRLFNLDVFEYELWNPMALYGSVPFMIAHRPGSTTGLLWLNAAETWIDTSEVSSGGFFGGEKISTSTHWFSESGVIDVFFMFAGPNPHNIFQQYSQLTGSTALPPLFSIAYHQCKWNYRDEAEVLEVDSNYDNHNIPMDVVWLDIEHTDSKKYFTWDSNHFPNPVNMINKLAEKGRKMVTIIDPHIKRDSGYSVHTSAQSAGDLYVKSHDGQEYEGHCWPGSSSWIDYSDSKARKWWSDLFSFDHYKESTPTLFTWNDMNEPSVFSGPEVTMHKDAIHYKGWEHRDIHNIYGMYMHMATMQGLINRNKGQNLRPFVLSRAFYVGSQRYGAIWTGDNGGQWSHLEAAQPMLLTLGLAGIAFSGADVGGFFGNPDSELLTRWYQAASWQPFFRAHAHIDSKRREPWLAGQPWTGLMARAIETRYTYLPYWYTLYSENYRTGLPMMRPLWVEYPADVSILAEEQTFLVGRDILVKPVIKAKEDNMEIYFPGKNQVWYDVVDVAKYNGESKYTVSTPIHKTPFFHRGGTIIPKKERIRRSSSLMKNDPYTLVVALDNNKQASGELYIDDENSFDYQKGIFLRRKFDYENNKLTSSAIGSESYSAVNTIERIVIYGLDKAPSSVNLEGSGKLEFTFQTINGVGKLTVRKPDVLITKTWTITFTF